MDNEKHYCQINAHGFALAVTGVVGAFYIVCSALVSLWPQVALKIFGWMIHLINLEQFAVVKINFNGFLVGLAQMILYTYIGAWLVAWLHNKFSVKMKSAGKMY